MKFFQMKWYQWHDESLKKKAKRLTLIAVLCAVGVLALFFAKTSVWLMWMLLIGAIVCYVLSWRLQSKDAKLKHGKTNMEV